MLIGTEGPDDTWKLPHTFDAQLLKLSYLATGTDVMVRALEKVMRRLEEAPGIVSITLEDGGDPVDVTVSRFGLERILLDDLGDSNDFVLFPAMITMLEEGDVSLLARYVEKRFRGMRRGIPLMSLATDCASGASPERRMMIEKQRATSMFPRTNYPYPAICSAVGATDLSEEFRSPVRTTVPTLFISGSLDAQTPPFQAERERWSFTKSAHIVVVNAGHEDLDNNLDVIAAVIRFLRGENVASATIDAPRPKFVSVEELKRRMNE